MALRGVTVLRGVKPGFWFFCSAWNEELRVVSPEVRRGMKNYVWCPRKSVPPPRPAGVPHPRRRRTTWASVFQAEFLEGLRLENIELELGQRFRRQRLNLLLDFGRQRAELGFH